MTELTEQQILAGFSPRLPESSKRDYGKLACVCGSTHYRGAAVLAVSAALRSGVGLVQLCSIPDVLHACAVQNPAATYLPLAEAESGTITADSARTVCAALHAADACLVGCGLGRSRDAQDLVARLVLYAPCRLVLDADALYALSKDRTLLKSAAQTPILTPHIGEFARLFGTTVAEIDDIPASALALAGETNSIVVLKGHTTYIAAPDGRLSNCTIGNAGMAKGGSGDLLAGLIGGLTAQGYDPYFAACAGVYLAGAAGDLCAKRLGMAGMIPGDQLADLCAFYAAHGL